GYAISEAKREIWNTYLHELQRIDVYKALKRIKEQRSAVFPSICDPNSGNTILSHEDRGRVLGRGVLAAVDQAPGSPDVNSATRADHSGSGARTMRGEAVVRLPPPSGVRPVSIPVSPITSEARVDHRPTDYTSQASLGTISTTPDVTPATCADQSGSGARTMRGEAVVELPPPPSARQGSTSTSLVTSEACLEPSDPVSLAESIPIINERPFVPPTNAEIDNATYNAGTSVLGDWIRALFRASLVLGTKPTPFKRNIATPLPKAGKKDKTSPKAWRPVENHEHALAKSLERLVADRIGFEVESLGPFRRGSIRRASRSQSSPGSGRLHPSGSKPNWTQGTLSQHASTTSRARITASPTLSFLFPSSTTTTSLVVIDGVRTVTFMCEGEGAPQGSALSVNILVSPSTASTASCVQLEFSLSWKYGFVDDTNFSTASKSPSQNVIVLNQAAQIAGRSDLSDYHITFDGEEIYPSDSVKWLGVWIDSKLSGTTHIKSRAGSAARALNASMALTHSTWGLKPEMVRDIHAHRASALHYVERIPLVNWPPNVPTRGSRIRERKPRLPMDVTTATRADLVGSGARGKRGEAVTILPPPPGARQVHLTASPVTSDAPGIQITTVASLGMELIRPVYSPPWTDALAVQTIIPTKDYAIATLNSLLASHSSSRDVWYTDGSLLDGIAGGAAVRIVNDSTSREYNFVHWLPGHNRSPARLIEEGAILRCWVNLRARRETTEDGTTRISAWILDGTSVTRCYRSIRHDAVRRRVQLRRVPDMIDLTQVGDDTGIRAASESRTGVRDIIDLTQVADAGVSAASGTRTDVEMIDLSIDD
ncbi:hypothetical protein C8F01DRAFT_1085765, partial [Mycena amicta]